MTLELITVAIAGAIKLIEFATKSTAHLKQTGELTPAEETKLDADISKLTKKLAEHLKP